MLEKSYSTNPPHADDERRASSRCALGARKANPWLRTDHSPWPRPLPILRPAWSCATRAWSPVSSRQRSIAERSWPPPDLVRGSAGPKSGDRARAARSFPEPLGHGRAAEIFAWQTDRAAKPEAHRAAGGGTFRFSLWANRRDWLRCAGGSCCLRASPRGGGWRVGSRGWGRWRYTCEHIITPKPSCQV